MNDEQDQKNVEPIFGQVGGGDVTQPPKKDRTGF
jgi:hypothetical protein